MKYFYQKKLIDNHLWGLYVLAFILLCLLTYYQWVVGLILFVISIVVFIDHKRREQLLRKRRITFLTEISYQVEKAGEESFLNMPMGIIIYNDDFEVVWANPYIYKLNDSNSLLGKPLSFFSDQFATYIMSEETEVSVNINESEFKVTINRENKTLYLQNHTIEKQLEKQIFNEQTVFANVYLDNYDEISRNMNDDLKSKINAGITGKLNTWAEDNNLFIKRIAQDRYFAILTKEMLIELEKTKFKILDEMRELHIDERQISPITLSIGIGTGNVPVTELAKIAQSSLDVALGRGGDQVTIRAEDGNVRFYGGKTNPMEKRTRVRARVVSHAIKELVKQSDNVIIMGHKSPDMDSLGAAIGVLNIAKSNQIDGYVIYDEDDITTGINRVINKVKENQQLWNHFISPEQANDIFTPRSLVILVDTHRPSFAAHEELLNKAEYKVVIDHHRRSEEFVDSPTLVYMEPYASSTSELVTELIEYQPKKEKLLTVEATALLAGIIVDTKSFAFRTGSRTFDAASYLRLKGADPVMVQQFLKDDLAMYIKRNKLVEKCYIYRDEMGIVRADDDEVYSHITIAQTADTLLTINKVRASFVIGKNNQGVVMVSARSLGDVNVQVIMEEMNGGGHLTNAATQVHNMSLEEVEKLLKEKIDNYYEGEIES